MSRLVLIEHTKPDAASVITESKNGGKDYYLSGIFCQADVKNGNGRIYPLDELEKAVAKTNKIINEGYSICGELNHPNDLQINLERVSHMITELRVSGKNVVGKAKILNTPMGNILKNLLEDGVKVGVSSRGTGEVFEGKVKNFDFVTVDAVATPSAPSAYPELIRESLENHKIMTLAEATCHDPKAQLYLQKEIRALLESIMKNSK